MARVRLGRATRSSWQTVVLPPPDGAERTINKGQFFSLVMALCRPGEGRPRGAGQRAARRPRAAADPAGLPLGRVDHWRWESAWPWVIRRSAPVREIFPTPS